MEKSKHSDEDTDGDKTPAIKMQNEDPQAMNDLKIVLFGRNDPKRALIQIIQDTGIFTQEPQQEYPRQKYSTSFNNKNVVIIDTPGVDTGGNEKKNVLEEIKWSVAAADPGPHVFLFVETINKSLSDKLEALEDFQKTFGEQANDFTMMVFIAASEMNTSDPDSCGSERVKPFRKLTYPFNHRYFIFNIKDDKQQQESQVTKLLEKIAEMGGEASAHFYTPKMVWEAEKAAKQEEQKQEEERQKQEEKRQKQKEERQDKVRDRWFVIAAQIGATIGLLISAFVPYLDSASAGAVGSIVGVIIAAVLYLMIIPKCKN